jgi:2'-5' RNA ligase
MRLFVAIELTEAARSAIAAEQQRIAQTIGSDAPRFVRPEQMHLTLAFIGDTTDDRAASIVAAAAADIPRPPFCLGFGGPGVFPPHGAPRVLWLGVVGGGPDVIELQAVVALRLQTAGVLLEDRRFHPHLTLARWRSPSTRSMGRAARGKGGHGSFNMLHDDQATPKVVASMDVVRVTLFQSRLSPAGSIHTALAHGHLRPDAGRSGALN